MEVFGALGTGMLIAGGGLLVWTTLGFIVGVARYVATPPPPPPPGPCATCVRLQSLWDSMSWVEKGLAYLNFFAAHVICAKTGCGGLILGF